MKQRLSFLTLLIAILCTIGFATAPTTILSSDLLVNSRQTINTNFSDLYSQRASLVDCSGTAGKFVRILNGSASASVCGTLTWGDVTSLSGYPGVVSTWNGRAGAVLLTAADVAGVEQDLRISASPTFVGMTLNGALSVAGASTLTGNTTVGGALGITGTTTGAASSFTNGTYSGTLGVTGNATVGGTFGVTGNSTVGGTLGITGTTTGAASSFTDGTYSGALIITGTTTGAASSFTNGTYSGTLGVTGTSTLGVVSVLGTLTTVGNTRSGGTLKADGLATASAGLIVEGIVPSSGAGQIALSGTTAASSNCGSLAGAAGCLSISVAGTPRYVPYY